MPVKAEPKERPIIRMLLSACDNGAWQSADLDWVEEKQDGTVEVIATRVDGIRLALEHTLIQPFVGEKFDSEVFMRAFGRIEKNAGLTVPERLLDVIIPVGAIPKGYDWDEVGQDLLNWLLANHAVAPREGEASYVVPVAAICLMRIAARAYQTFLFCPLRLGAGGLSTIDNAKQSPTSAAIRYTGHIQPSSRSQALSASCPPSKALDLQLPKPGDASITDANAEIRRVLAYSGVCTLRRQHPFMQVAGGFASTRFPYAVPHLP